MVSTGVAIVAIIFSSIALQRYFKHKTDMKKLEVKGSSSEVKQLRHELQKLQQRVGVLETIVTDKGYQLKEEIKEL